MKKMLRYLLTGGAFFAFEIDFSIIDYCQKIGKKEKNHAYAKTKTFYQNPNFKQSNSYYNKTIPKNRFSQISEKGKRIRYNNLQIKIRKEGDKQLKERGLEIALRKK